MKKSIEEINKEVREIMRGEDKSLLDELLQEFNDENNSLIQLCIKREKFVSDFRTLPDFVSITDAVLYSFCAEVDIDTNRSIGFTRSSYDYYFDPENSDMTMHKALEPTWLSENLNKYLLRCFERIEYLINTGAYIYSTPLKSSNPINESSKTYLQIKKAIDATWTAISNKSDNHSIKKLNQLNKYFVSRSELNQLTLFNAATSKTTSHHKEVRKNAYRMYLETGFLESHILKDDNSNASPTIHEKRELILIGWMAAKKLPRGSTILIGRKKCWNELEGMCPDFFSKKDGSPLGINGIKKFFDLTVKNQICKFS